MTNHEDNGGERRQGAGSRNQAYEVIEAFYGALGVPTLTRALAERSVIETVGPEEAARYARVAAIRASGLPIRLPDGTDCVEDFRDWTGSQLWSIISGEGLGGTEEHPTVRGFWSDDHVELDQTLTRHIEWMFELLDSADVARDYIAASRAEAEGQAETSYAAAFEEVVSTF